MSNLNKSVGTEAKSLKEWMNLHGVEDTAVRLPTSIEFQNELSGIDLANRAIDEIIRERTLEANP